MSQLTSNTSKDIILKKLYQDFSALSQKAEAVRRTGFSTIKAIQR